MSIAYADKLACRLSVDYHTKPKQKINEKKQNQKNRKSREIREGNHTSPIHSIIRSPCNISFA